MVNLSGQEKCIADNVIHISFYNFCRRQNLGKIVDLFLKSQSAPGEDALVVD
jgi:hypothetical protein